MLQARGPAGHAAGHSLSQWPDSTRDHLPNPSRRGGSTPSSDCNARRAEPPDGKSDRLDKGEPSEAATGGRYESASQFNREYSRFFGQPPMRDIRTLRSPSAPPLESVSNR